MKNHFQAALVFGVMASASTPADAIIFHRPGTPINLTASLVAPTTIRLSWLNANAGPKDQPFVTYFDIQGAPGDPSFANEGAMLGYHEEFSFDVKNLQVGQQHCFKIWTRESPNGIRSEQPTAWSCLTIPAPIQSAPPAPGAKVYNWAGTVFPVWSNSPVWTVADPDCLINTSKGYVSDPGVVSQTKGYVLYVPAGRACPAPYRDVVYQYGGYPGIYGIGMGLTNYHLCWYSQFYPPKGAKPWAPAICPQPSPPSAACGGHSGHLPCP